MTAVAEVVCPCLRADSVPACQSDFEDWVSETSDWLGLVALQSPRVSMSDVVDPFLSRYRVDYTDSTTASKVTCIKWTGLIDEKWIRQLFIVLW